MCWGCPFTQTAAAEEAYNLGCLPAAKDIIELCQKEGKDWGCHETEKAKGNLKVCKGYLAYLKSQGQKPTGEVLCGYEEKIL